MDIKKLSTIFIRNFASKFNTRQKLQEGFERFGPIENVYILKTPKQDLIGYVEFKMKESAIQAIETVDGLSAPDGQTIKVSLLKECNDSINNLYIKNIPESIDENVLESLFKKYGSIVSTTVMRDDQGKSRGFGFVCFYNEVHAAVAKKDMNGFEVNGKQFDISFAQKKENREAYLTAEKKGILLKEVEAKKGCTLPLEQRIVRRPTKFELASYSVPCLGEMPAYGNMFDWQRAHLASNSMMKMPSMSFPPIPENVEKQHQNCNNNNNMYLGRKYGNKAFRSNYQQQSKFGKNSDPVAKQKNPVENSTNETPQESRPNQKYLAQNGMEVLKDLLLPKLQKLYPPYATDIMHRLMQREYKEVLRLVGNHRLLYKTASNEVQKIKVEKEQKRPKK